MNKDIIIFHHSYLVNNWLEIITEQLDLLKKSNLYENAEQIHFCCYSEIKENIIQFFSLIKEFDDQKKCTIVIEPYNDNERLTLTYMQSFCKNSSEKKVLYFHTKGVTSYLNYGEENFKNIRSWRKIMEYYVIENWQKCAELTINHDVIGIFYGKNYVHNGLLPFFSGNFWWSKVSHINKTPDMRDRDNWLGCESLITSIPHIWYNFRSPEPNKDMYSQYFDPSAYRDF